MSVIPAEIEHRLTEVEERSKSNTKRIDAHDKELKDIITLLSARPTWAITAVICILTTVTASLMVYVSTMHH